MPICKDDLVCIPVKQARSLSNINPLTICARVGNSLQLLDPQTLQTCEIPSQIYWRAPFDSLACVTDLVQFTILDIEPDRSRTRGKLVLADAQVALAGAFTSSAMKDEDSMDYEGMGSTAQVYHTRTHLGAILQPGDTALGYFLTNSNYNSDHFAELPPARVPDIILVKKTYPNRRKVDTTELIPPSDTLRKKYFFYYMSLENTNAKAIPIVFSNQSSSQSKQRRYPANPP